MKKELPQNWILTTTKEISSIIRGVSYKKADAKSIQDKNDYLVLRGGNIQDGEIVFNNDRVFIDKSFVKDEQKILKGDVVIVGSTGSKKLIGKAGIAKENLKKISFGAFLMLLRPYTEINKSYFDYFFISKQYRDKIRELAGGVNINNIRKEYIADMPFPLPPLSEQTRIVAKLDQLFGQLEQIKESLDKIPKLLKDFRQQVLTQAVTGKLTAEWREGRNLENWKSNLLGECCKITMGQSPPGSTYNDVGEGVPLINGPVEFGGIDPFSKTKKVKFTTKPTKFCEVNDLLICVRGSTTGRINISGFRACIGRGVAAIKAKKLSQEYVNIFMRLQYAKILSMGTGSTFPSISGDFLRKYEINVPPKKEQQEIVNRVETLFAKADTLQQQYQTLKQKIETLPQAILHKAFKGELVPQLESDGDARELLEEIKALKKHTAKPISKKPKAYKVYDVELGRVAEDGKEYSKK